jgi:hypothetical protein
MLMVTTTVGMLNWILRHTTNLGPAVTLDRVLVKGSSGLEQGLVSTASSSNDTNLSADCRWNSLLSATGKTQPSGALVVVMSDDNSKGSTSTSKCTAVSKLCLNVTDNCSFRDSRERQDVSYTQGCLLSAIDELTSVHAFCAYDQFGVALIAVGVSELHLGYRSTSTRVVEDFLNYTTNVTMLLSIIECSKLDGALSSTRMRLKDSGLTTTLTLHLQNKDAR